MLKDEFTVYYVTYMLIGLVFKLFLIDTYYKENIDDENSCPLFISGYLPQIFILMAICVFMIKSLMLQIVLQDNEEKYRYNHKGRVGLANWVFRLFQLILFIILMLRYLNNCYPDKIKNIFNFPSQA